jgi:transposase
MEAMRCVKRRLSDIVYQHVLNDEIAHAVTGPGGQQGNDSDSSATDSHPHVGSSDKPLPGPATNQPMTPLRKAG